MKLPKFITVLIDAKTYELCEQHQNNGRNLSVVYCACKHLKIEIPCNKYRDRVISEIKND